MKKKLVFAALITALAIGGLFTAHRVKAQVSTIVGQLFPTNYLAPTAGAQMAAVGGVTTNPSSNFVMQISAGTVWCYQGAALEIPQAQLTLQASNTYLLVFNCNTQTLYAKTAVTGPGSSGTSSLGNPPPPSSILFPIYGLEIPIATVVCNATACGNGGNGSITDARVPAQWLIGIPTGAHIITPAATNDVAFTVTLAANTATKTWTIPYQVAPVVVCTDQTTPQLVKAAPTTTNVVITDTVGATDVVNCIAVANPN